MENPSVIPNPEATATNVASMDLKQLARHMGEVESFCHDKLNFPADQRFRSQIQTTHLGLFRLVVMGEIKKGKSSFINALCGIENLVPELSDVATSSIYKIRYADILAYDVFYKGKKEESKYRKQTIQKEQLAEFGTETGNPGNQKAVDFIAVQAPSAILSDGLIIVDTPGVGGLFKEHKGITWKYAPNADAVFFVTDSLESPIGAEEVVFLKELRKITGLIFFIQTKSDRVDRAAAQKRMENNLQILEAQVGIPRTDLVYFIVSSKLKILADKSRDLDDLKASGFLPLMAFLNIKLKGAKDRNLTAVSVSRTSYKLGEVAADVDKREKVLAADSKEKQDALDLEYKKAENAVNEWKMTKAPEMERTVRRAIQDNFADAMKEMNQALRPGGVLSEQAREKLSHIKNAREIYLASNKIASDLQSSASQVVLKTSKNLEDNVQAVIRTAASKVGAEIQQVLDPGKDLTVAWNGQVSLDQLSAKGTHEARFATARTAFYGGALGVSLASIAGGIIGSVIPVVGTIIGSSVGMVIGGLIGGGLSLDLQNEQEAEKARMEVQNLLDREVSNMLATIQADMTKLQTRLVDCALDGLKAILTQTSERLQAHKKQIENRRKMDGQALADEAKYMAELKNAFKRLADQQEMWEKRLA